MPEVLLLDVDPDDADAVEAVRHEPGSTTVHRLARGDAPRPSADGCVVLIGSGDRLLGSLQWAHATLPAAKMAVLAPEVEHDKVRRLVQFAPGVPLDLQLLDPRSAELPQHLAELCLAATREQEYVSVLAGIRGSGQAGSEGPSVSRVLVGPLLEHAPIGVVVVDADQRVIGWNRVATTLLRCDGSMSGQPVGGLFAAPAPVESLVTAAAAGPLANEALQVTVVGPDDRHLDVEAALSTAEDGREVVLLLVQDASRRLRVEAERDQYGAHVDMLVGLSESLLSAPDPDTALQQLGAELTMSFCDWVAFHAYDARGATARVVVEHRDPSRGDDVAEIARLLPGGLTDQTPSRRISRGEGPMLLPEVTEEMVHDFVPDARTRRVLGRLGARSAIAVPLAGSSGVLGSMVLFRGEDSRSFDESDLKVGVEVGRRAGLVFEVLEASRRQRLVNEELQRSMLTDPPVLEAGRVVARYQPATDEAQVGGDWYDSFVRADGTLMLTVGDVVGHDIRSAAAMGQVRGLLRGIGYTHRDGPASVVGQLDAAVQSLHPGITATTVVVRLGHDPEESRALRLCWTSAGHPAPVVMRAHGSCELLDGECDLLLGVLPGTDRHEQEAVLRSGDTVLLFSDGLIERRGRDLDDGLDALLEAARDLCDEPPDVVCDVLLQRLLDEAQDDDVCLIAFRVR